MAESPQMPQSEVESNYPRLTKRQLAVLSMTEEEQVHATRLMWASSLFLAFIPGLIHMKKYEKGTILHYHGTCSAVSWLTAIVFGGIVFSVIPFFPDALRFPLSYFVIHFFANPFGSAIFEALFVRTYEGLENRSSVATPFVRWVAYSISGSSQ